MRSTSSSSDKFLFARFQNFQGEELEKNWVMEIGEEEEYDFLGRDRGCGKDTSGRLESR